MAITIVQTKADYQNGTSLTLDAAPTAGNTLLCWHAVRVTRNPGAPDGFTALGSAYVSCQFSSGADQDRGRWSRRIVQSGDSATLTGITDGGGAKGNVLIVELANVETGALDTYSEVTNQTGATVTGGNVTPTGSCIILGGAVIFVGDASTETATPGASITELHDSEPGGFHPLSWVGYRVLTSPSGAYAISCTPSASPTGGWGVQTIVLRETALGGGSYADWNGLGFGDALSDLSSDVISWRITRGASPEITNGASPGNAVITLRNRDNRYNPENTGGTLYSYLRDGVPLWIGVADDGTFAGTVANGLFGGRTADITPLPVPGHSIPPTVEITAEDDLARLGRVEVAITPSRTRSHADLRTAILTDASVSSYTIPPEIATMPLSGGKGTALTMLEELNRATGTRHFVQPADSAGATWATYVARDRQWGLAGTASVTLGTADHVHGITGWRKSADTVINQQRVSFNPVTFTPAQVTVWESDETPFGIRSTGGVGWSYERWVEFDDYVDGPTLDINYTGSSVTSTLTAFGNTAKVTLVSAGTSTVSSLSIEGQLAKRPPAESYVADNSTSQADPRGVRSGPDISSEMVGVLASARGLGEHIVWRYGSPQVRPTLTVVNWMPEQFQVDLFDVISVSSTQLGVTSRLFEVVGVTHEGHRASSNNVHHVTTYVLEECRVQSAATVWFITDTHAPDGTAITGY